MDEKQTRTRKREAKHITADALKLTAAERAELAKTLSKSVSDELAAKQREVDELAALAKG